MRPLTKALAATFLTLAGILPAAAQDNPLAGRTIELLSGYSDGSISNSVLQEFARAMQRVVPDLRVVFRTNSGGTSALNMTMIAEAAPDGFTIGTVEVESLISRMRGDVQYDISDFAVIGGFGRNYSVVLASTASGISSFSDLVGADRNFVVPVRGTTSATYYQALMINAWLGTRMLPVAGYDAGARMLAFVSGEAPLIANQVQSAVLQLIADGAALPVLNIVSDNLPPEYSAAPALADLPGNPEFGWVTNYLALADHYLLLGTRRDVPPEILAALREVFLAVIADSRFAEAVGPLMPLDPVPGEVVERMISEFTGEGIDLAARFDRVIACGLQLAETGIPCS